MKVGGVLFLSAIGGVIYYAMNKFYTKTYPAMPQIETSEADTANLQTFKGKGQKNVELLNSLAHGLSSAIDPGTGNVLTDQQIRILLAQALQESGLFTTTPGPNLKLVRDYHNYTGIKVGSSNKQYKTAGSVYAKYPTIDDYIKDWLRILNRDLGGGAPIQSTTLQDFVTRLNVNGYFAPSSFSAYKRNLPIYYNQLATFQIA